MRAWVLIGLIAGACGKDDASKAEVVTQAPADLDCALIAADPASAPARLSAKYPGEPIKVAEVIERCVAPTGATCDRMAKIWAAIPSMMPGAGSGSATVKPTADSVALCQGMPAEMQRCMLPSYVIGHTDECAKTFETMVASIDVGLRRDRPLDPPPPCAELTIELAAKSIVYRRGAEETVTPHKNGLPDWAAFETGLKTYARKCAGDASLAPTGDVLYQDVITAMDLAMKVGFSHVGYETGEPSKDPPPTPAPLTPAAARDDLQVAPVLVVTKTEVSLDGKTLATVDVDATDAVKAALVARPVGPASDKRLVILQADQSASARTITQVIVGAQRAGYDNVLFAVKNK